MGKGGGSASASLADPSEAMASYQKAADVIEKQFPIALQTFKQYSEAGVMSQLENFAKAQEQGAPFSQTAKDAMSELRGFLGMAPLSKTLGMSYGVGAIADGLNFTMIDPLYGKAGTTKDLQRAQGLMDRAEMMTDPAQRAAAREEILGSLDRVINDMHNGHAALSNADVYNSRSAASRGQSRTLSDRNIKPGLDYEYDVNGRPAKFVHTFDGLPEGANPMDYGYMNFKGEAGTDNTGLYDFAADFIDNPEMPLERRKAGYAIGETIAKVLPDIQNMRDSFAESFEIEPPKAPTTAEITKKLEGLPEYQFQLNQGLKATERSQAARGTLQSGGALLEAQKVGQGTAEAVYSRQLNQLGALAGMNMPVVQQSINGYANQGNTMLNQSNMVGQTGQTSIQDIARSRESAFIRSGDAQLQTALMNAQLQTQANMQNAASGGGGMGGIGQLAGSVLGMIL